MMRKCCRPALMACKTICTLSDLGIRAVRLCQKDQISLCFYGSESDGKYIRTTKMYGNNKHGLNVFPENTKLRPYIQTHRRVFSEMCNWSHIYTFLLTSEAILEWLIICMRVTTEV